MRQSWLGSNPRRPPRRSRVCPPSPTRLGGASANPRAGVCRPETVLCATPVARSAHRRQLKIRPKSTGGSLSRCLVPQVSDIGLTVHAVDQLHSTTGRTGIARQGSQISHIGRTGIADRYSTPGATAIGLRGVLFIFMLGLLMGKEM